MSALKKQINRVWPIDREAWGAVVEVIEILTGRRDNKITKLREVKLAAAAAPTKAEYDALALEVVTLQMKVNELIDRLDG
jgi:hypothetical protein